MSSVLEVSRSGYYSWLKRKPSKQKLRKVSLQEAIRKIYESHNGYVGSPYLTRELQDMDKFKNISRSRVALEMKEMGIRCRTHKKYVPTTDSRHDLPTAENILDRQFNQTSPNKAWVSDITYIKVGSKWVYFVMFLDLFNREIVGWDLSKSLETTSTLKALRRAINRRDPEENLIIHSDQGIQYASDDFKKELEKNNTILIL